MIRTHNHLVCIQTLNHLAKFQASLAKWLSVCLWTKWLWVWITLLSLKLQIWHLLQAMSPLTFRQTIECRFTLKLMWCDMIKIHLSCIKPRSVEFIFRPLLDLVQGLEINTFRCLATEPNVLSCECQLWRAEHYLLLDL